MKLISRKSIFALFILCSFLFAFHPLRAQNPQWQNGGVPIFTGVSGVDMVLLSNEGAFLIKNSNITDDGSGGFIACWYHEKNGSVNITAQRVSRNGALLWNNSGVAVSALPGVDKNLLPECLSDGAGGAYLSWYDDYQPRDSTFILAGRIQHISNAGVLLWGDSGYAVTPVQTTTADTSFGISSNVEMDNDGAGGVVLCYYYFPSGGDAGHGTIFVERVNGGAGAPNVVWGPVAITAASPDEIMDSLWAASILADSGGAILSWHTKSPATDTIVHIHVARISSAGAVAWNNRFTFARDTDTKLFGYNIVSDNAGGAIVTASYFQNSQNGNIVTDETAGLRISSDGNALWGPKMLAHAASGIGVPDGAGGMYNTLYNNVTILNGGSTTTCDLFLQHWDNAGNALYTSGSPGIPLGNQEFFDNAMLTTDRAGNVICTWGTDAISAVVQKYGSRTGAPMWGSSPLRLSSDSAITPIVLADGADGAFICWNGFSTVQVGSSIAAQHVASATGVDETKQVLPQSALLNYPNPFSKMTNVEYRIPNEGLVTLKVYNALGEKIATLVNGEESAGAHSVSFNASDLQNGMYFYRLTNGSFSQSGKMIVMH